MTRIVVDQVRGRVPVVINTGAAGTDLAVFYSRTAERNGADALMVIPPSFMPAGPDEVREYYRAISERGTYPDLHPGYARLRRSPPGWHARSPRSAEHVRYIKVETLP